MRFTATITNTRDNSILATADGTTAAKAIRAAGRQVTRPVHNSVRVSVSEGGSESFFAYDYGVPAAVETAIKMDHKAHLGGGR